MKKTLFLSIMAIALVLVGCDSTTPSSDDETTYTSISITPDSASLEIGDTKRFSVLYEPASAAAPTVAWTTSDSAVATVANGVVTAVAAGKATITATVGTLTATATVTVASAEDLFEFSYMYLTNTGDQIGTDVYQDTLRNGTVVTSKLYDATWLITDDGVTVATDKSFVGAGYVAIASAPVLVIATPAEYAGYYLGGMLTITSDKTKENQPYTALAGEIADFTKYAGYWETYLTGETPSEDDYCITGTPICYYSFDEQSMSYYLALVKDTYIYGSDEEADMQYMLNIQWFEGYYGIALTSDSTALKTPYEYVYTDQYYEKGITTTAAPKQIRSKAVNMPKQALNAKRIDTKRFYKK